MTSSALETVLRSFARRHPFRPFWLELMSGDRIKATHPEAVRRTGELFSYRGTDGAHRFFAAESVCQVLEEPVEKS